MLSLQTLFCVFGLLSHLVIFLSVACCCNFVRIESRKYIVKGENLIVSVFFILLDQVSYWRFCIGALFLAHMKGNQGAVHLIETDADIAWMIEHGPHKPYVPILYTNLFNE